MAAAAYLYPMESLSPEEREALIIEHLPQVRLIARKIHERMPETVALEDLISAGVLGLISAVDNYDSTQNVKLKTYAEFRIRGAILDSLRESDWAPRMKRRQARDIEAAVSRAEQRLRRVPQEEEIAAELGVSIPEYRQRLTEIAALDIGELEYAREEDGASGLVRYVAASEVESPALQLERAELERLITTAIEAIPKIERVVLSLYFYEELTLKEIGEILELHFSRVSQIKLQAILRLRSAIAKRWPGVRG